MITDTSKTGTLVGTQRIVRRSIPLVGKTTIFYGNRGVIGFGVQFQDHRGHQELYDHAYRVYAVALGTRPSLYASTHGGATPFMRPVGRDYAILHTIGQGNFGTVHAVVHQKSGNVYAAKEIQLWNSGYLESDDQPFGTCDLREYQEGTGCTVPREVDIFSKLKHVRHSSLHFSEALPLTVRSPTLSDT